MTADVKRDIVKGCRDSEVVHKAVIVITLLL